MGKATQEQLSASDIVAEATLTSEARNQALYERKRFTENDKAGGHMDSARMRKVAPVVILERLFNPPRGVSAFHEAHKLAAFEYHAILEQSQGSMNYEIVERVQSSMTPKDSRAWAISKKLDIDRQLPVDAVVYLRLIFEVYKDFPFSALDGRKDFTKDGIVKTLEELALYLGLMT